MIQMKTTTKKLLTIYRIGCAAYLGGKVLKAAQSKPFLQDEELHLQLTRVLVDHFTPLIAADLGVDLTTVTHSVGELPDGYCDLFAPLHAQALTFYQPGATQTHIHYYHDRVLNDFNRWMVGVEDYSVAIVSLVAHELTHCRQQQGQGIGGTKNEVFWAELEAYPTGFAYAMKYKKQIKALLKEIGF